MYLKTCGIAGGLFRISLLPIQPASHRSRSPGSCSRESTPWSASPRGERTRPGRGRGPDPSPRRRRRRRARRPHRGVARACARRLPRRNPVPGRRPPARRPGRVLPRHALNRWHPAPDRAIVLPGQRGSIPSACFTRAIQPVARRGSRSISRSLYCGSQSRL